MTWFYEALELMNADGARSGRFRVCKTSDEDGGGPYGLCDCEGGHESQDAARDCPIAKAKLSIAFPSHVEAVAPQMTEVDALEAACDQNFLDNVDTTLPLDEQGLALTGLINCAKSLASRLRTAILACEREKQRADEAEGKLMACEVAVRNIKATFDAVDAKLLAVLDHDEGLLGGDASWSVEQWHDYIRSIIGRIQGKAW